MSRTESDDRPDFVIGLDGQMLWPGDRLLVLCWNPSNLPPQEEDLGGYSWIPGTLLSVEPFLAWLKAQGDREDFLLELAQQGTTEDFPFPIVRIHTAEFPEGFTLGVHPLHLALYEDDGPPNEGADQPKEDKPHGKKHPSQVCLC